MIRAKMTEWEEKERKEKHMLCNPVAVHIFNLIVQEDHGPDNAAKTTERIPSDRAA